MILQFNFEQLVMKTRINIIILVLFSTIGTTFAQIEGSWKGQLDLGAQKLETAFNIEATENGYSATFDVPAQGAFDVPVDETVFQDNQLLITMSALGASYSGTLKNDIIEGTFKCFGRTMKQAVAIDENFRDEIPSTKGVL